MYTLHLALIFKLKNKTIDYCQLNYYHFALLNRTLCPKSQYYYNFTLKAAKRLPD